jgi:hypothetical protein
VKVGLTFTGHHLAPLDEQDLEVLRAAYGVGEIVSVDVKKARNLKHHRLFFALFREQIKHGCVLHGHRFHDPEALRAYVEICIEWCDYYDVGPIRVPVPRTIRFDIVDQTEFTTVFNNAVLFMADEIESPCSSVVYEADELRSKGIGRTSLRNVA